MLGSGVPEFEQRMRQEEQERPDHFRGWVGFSIPVSHRIMAGCDILLMPSRFEPCGLNQLFGMRYGTIPIAHATGGLRDTIEDYNPFADGKCGYLLVSTHFLDFPSCVLFMLTCRLLSMSFCSLAKSSCHITDLVATDMSSVFRSRSETMRISLVYKFSLDVFAMQSDLQAY